MSKVYVVGIGPGNYENFTIKADSILQKCDVLVGYTVYVDLIKELYPNKEFLSTPMTQEVERCQRAIDMALDGKTVAVICSGDSGIYGMASLIYELRGSSLIPEIEVVPGLTAACSGAAIIGAPLTHDFAVISLSDRLTSWDKIKSRLIYAAKADLSIVLYNPASKGRPMHLKNACEVLLQELPSDRICAIAKHIGREGEAKRILTLSELMHTAVDMFCTVFIGNSSTKRIEEVMITPRGYKNV